MTPSSNPLVPSVPPTPSFQLERDIQAKNFERQRLNPLPVLDLLRNKLVELTALAAINAAKYSADLFEAQQRFSDAVDLHEKAKVLEAEVKDLERQRAEAVTRERAEAAQAANRALDAAWTEYNAMSLAAAKAFRAVAAANAKAQQTPGSNVSTVPVGFNVPHLAYDGGVTTTLGQQMMMGFMSWEAGK